MSLYRETGRSARQGLIAAAVALVLGLGVGYLLGSAGEEEPSLADAVGALRTDMQPVANGLELLGGEYPQGVRDGKVVSQTEYEGSVSNIARIRATVADHMDDLSLLDPTTASELDASLKKLAAAVDSHDSPGKIDQLRSESAAKLLEIVPAADSSP